MQKGQTKKRGIKIDRKDSSFKQLGYAYNGISNIRVYKSTVKIQSLSNLAI